jgi:hypothetical protein
MSRLKGLTLKSKKDKLKVEDIYSDHGEDQEKLSQNDNKAPSYYEEDEEEYESEEAELEAEEEGPAKPQTQVGGWTDAGDE